MDFKFELGILKLGKNGYFCAYLNFFVNPCYYLVWASGRDSAIRVFVCYFLGQVVFCAYTFCSYSQI